MSLIIAEKISKDYQVVATKVSKDYGAAENVVRALRDVSFEIEPASFVSFIGPSGSGKTTLLNLIGCLDKLTEGNLSVVGTNVLKPDRHESIPSFLSSAAIFDLTPSHIPLFCGKSE